MVKVSTNDPLRAFMELERVYQDERVRHGKARYFFGGCFAGLWRRCRTSVKDG
jgi:hypothetical protein